MVAMSLAGVTLISIVSLWLLVSLLYQLRAVERLVARFDPFRFMPRWTFFAPNPGIRDYHLVWRSQDAKGEVNDWAEALICPARTAVSPYWHPQKKTQKCLVDAIQAIRLSLRDSGLAGSRVPLSIPYLLVLNAACQRARANGGSYVQFAILEATGHRERRFAKVLMSDMHEIGDAGLDSA